MQTESVFCIKDAACFLERLDINGAVEVRSSIERDVYYNHPERAAMTIAPQADWLQLHIADSECRFRFRRWMPMGSGWRPYRVDVDTGVSDVNAVQHLLGLLGFVCRR